MFLQNGVDIVEIDRIERLMTKPKFLISIFRDAERERIDGKPERAAGCFAAKEAISKALGTGFRGFSFRDIEITRNEWGAPSAILHGEARELLKNRRLTLSISHSKTSAVAFATIYEE